MNKFVLIAIFLFGFLYNLRAQTTISSHRNIYNRDFADSYKWNINGFEFKPSPDTIKLEVNFPLVDTIIFQRKRHNKLKIDTIYTRIPPNHHYLNILGCCDSYFDIYQIDSIKKKRPFLFDEEIEFTDSLYLSSKEGGKLRFKIVNFPKDDTLYAFFGDFVFELEAIPIFSDTITNWFWPVKGMYSNSVNFAGIGTKSTKQLNFPSNPIGYISMPPWEIDSWFERKREILIRIFEEENVTLLYDCITEKISLEFDKNAP